MPAKKSKKKKKGTKSSDQDFDYAIYQSNVLDTSISLLGTQEENILLSVLDKLIRYNEKHVANKAHLIEKGVLEKIPNLLLSQVVSIQKLTLKLCAGLVEDPRTVDELSEDLEIINCLSNYYTTSQDLVIQELSVFFLTKLVDNPTVLAHLVTEGLLGKIFKILQITSDPDIQHHSLSFMLQLLNAPEAKYILPEEEMYFPKILLCYILKHPLAEIQDLAFQNLCKLTSFQYNPLQVKMAEDKVVEAMFDVIVDENMEGFHIYALNVIIHSMQCEATAKNFVDSVEFIRFLDFAKSCPKQFIYPAAQIFYHISTFIDMHQILNDFAAEEALLSLFRVNDPKVHFYVCSAVKNFTQHRYLCENMLTVTTLKFILSMLQKISSPLSHRNVALETIFSFLKNNHKTVGMLHELDKLETIQDIFLNQRELFTNENIYTVMEIIHMYSARHEYTEELLHHEFYKTLVELFKGDNAKVSSKAITIMNCYANSRKAMGYLIEYGAPEAIVEKINSTKSQRLLKDMLVFIHNVLIHEDVCMSFLKAKLYLCLEAASDSVKENNPLIMRLVDKMYNIHLPLKFYKRGRLEIENKLKSGFFLINGNWKGNFPFLEFLDRQAISTRFTIYLVDYGSKDAESETSIKDADSWRENSVADMDSTKPFINYGMISPDTYLPEMIKVANAGLYCTPEGTILCTHHKAYSLALYVERQTSGMGAEAPGEQFNHYFKYHITCLKRKLGTNVIPIGFVRSGLYCERALLFKALADKVGIPSTLVRGSNGMYWNEVPPNIEDEHHTKSGTTHLVYVIVDLVKTVGRLMLCGSEEAEKYCSTADKIL